MAGRQGPAGDEAHEGPSPQPCAERTLSVHHFNAPSVVHEHTGSVFARHSMASSSSRADAAEAHNKGAPVISLPEEPSAIWMATLRYLRAILYVLNMRTLLLCGVASTLVYLCIRWKIRFSLNFDIVSVGTVFPLVFGVQQAFTRRERALAAMASLKGCMTSLYFCHRDWDVRDGMSARAKLGDNLSTEGRAARKLVTRFLTAVKEYLLHGSPYDSSSEQRLLSKEAGTWNLFLHQDTTLREADVESGGTPPGGKAPAPGMTMHSKLAPAPSMAMRRPAARLDTIDGNRARLLQCYEVINQINILNETLTLKAGYMKAGEGGMSRLAQYIRQAVEQLETLRFIKEYRTPIMMRYTCICLIWVCIVLLAPYFANLGSKMTSMWDEDHKGSGDAACPAGYVAACLYVIISMSLYKVMTDLEYPFDQEGLDDVLFDMPLEFDEETALIVEHQISRMAKLGPGTEVQTAVLDLGPSYLDLPAHCEMYPHFAETADGSIIPVVVRVMEMSAPNVHLPELGQPMPHRLSTGQQQPTLVPARSHRDKPSLLSSIKSLRRDRSASPVIRGRSAQSKLAPSMSVNQRMLRAVRSMGHGHSGSISTGSLGGDGTVKSKGVQIAASNRLTNRLSNVPHVAHVTPRLDSLTGLSSAFAGGMAARLASRMQRDTRDLVSRGSNPATVVGGASTPPLSKHPSRTSMVNMTVGGGSPHHTQTFQRISHSGAGAVSGGGVLSKASAGSAGFFWRPSYGARGDSPTGSVAGHGDHWVSASHVPVFTVAAPPGALGQPRAAAVPPAPFASPSFNVMVSSSQVGVAGGSGRGQVAGARQSVEDPALSDGREGSKSPEGQPTGRP